MNDDAADSKEPWLSILMPVFNVAPYLTETLASIVAQLPAAGVELLLLDDRSTDGSDAIGARICAEIGPAASLHRQAENGGVAAARNRLLDLARGDYVWFIDADDLLLPGAIAALHAIVMRDAPDLVLCDYRKRGRDEAAFTGTTRRIVTDREALLYGLFARRRMHLWTKIARRNLWHDLRFPPLACFEDMAVVPHLFLTVRSHYYEPAPWIDYRVREGSLTGLATRTAGHFDTAGNDALTAVLADIMAAVTAGLPAMHDDMRYCLAQFCAKEYTKIGWRLVSTRAGRIPWQALRRELRRYRDLTEAASPMPFAALVRTHRQHRKFGRWFVLALFVRLAA